MRYNEINEAFDSSYEYKTWPTTDGATWFTFNAGSDTNIGVYLHHLQNEFGFATVGDDPRKLLPKFELINSPKQQIKIFSTIKKIIESCIVNYELDHFRFNSWDQRTIPLYTKFANYLATNYGYKITSSDSDLKEGSFYFVLNN